MEITAITELDAVNEMLSVIGESPVNTLENLQIISEHTLNPDTYTKRIKWADNYLYLKGNNGEKLIKNGEYIKDLSTGDTTFNSPISAEVILLVPFEEMPEPMRSYIIAKASFSFQTRAMGSSDLTNITQSTVQEAWMRLQEYELDNNTYNMLDNTSVSELRKR